MAHKQVLTRLVLRQVKGLTPWGKITFDIWRKTRRTEFLPEGIPYKVSDVALIREANGTFVVGLNKPLILVSDLLDRAERANTARHEHIEWQRRRRAEDATVPWERESHMDAKRLTNRRLTKTEIGRAHV